MNWLALLNDILPDLIGVAVTVILAVATWLLSRIGLGDLVRQWKLNEVLAKALQWAVNQIPGVSLQDPMSPADATKVIELAEHYVQQNAPKTAAANADTLTQKLEARVIVEKDKSL